MINQIPEPYGDPIFQFNKISRITINGSDYKGKHDVKLLSSNWLWIYGRVNSERRNFIKNAMKNNAELNVFVESSDRRLLFKGTVRYSQEEWRVGTSSRRMWIKICGEGRIYEIPS